MGMVMQEKRLQNNWERFWKARKDVPVNKKPFYNNFMFLLLQLKKRFRDLSKIASLEVGCGRAIMSDYLHDYDVDTFTVDKHYVPPENGRKHKFYQMDALSEA